MRPVISVIVPVYRSEDSLPGCLDSLLRQTFGDIEIICVDDGSPDRCSEILAAYAAKDSRIRVFRQENGGLSSARNTGLANAAGEFVMFCDSDDWAEAGWCGELHRAIVGVREAGFATARAFIDGDCRRNRRRELERNQRLPFAGVREASPALFPRLDHSVWTKIFRRSVLERHGIRFPAGLLCEDWSFTYSCLAASRRVVFLDRLLYHYVQREGSILNGGERAERLVLDYVRQWDRLRRFLVADGKWPQWRLPVMEYGVRMFNIGGERFSERTCALAEEFLDAMPPEDFEGLPARLAGDLAAVRDRTLPEVLCRRYALGPLTLARHIRDISGDRWTFCGVKVFGRRY